MIVKSIVAMFIFLVNVFVMIVLVFVNIVNGLGQKRIFTIHNSVFSIIKHVENSWDFCAVDFR